LEDLWLSGNKICSFGDVAPLSVLGTREGACLEEIYLEYNPVADEFEYRKKLKELIPSLTKIDANMIGGLAAHGIPAGTTGGEALTREEQLRRMQEAVIARAKKEGGHDEIK
jgi:orotate phosphoribosyltransferase